MILGRVPGPPSRVLTEHHLLSHPVASPGFDKGVDAVQSLRRVDNVVGESRWDARSLGGVQRYGSLRLTGKTLKREQVGLHGSAFGGIG